MSFGYNKERITHLPKNTESDEKQNGPDKQTTLDKFGSPLPIPKEINGGHLIAQYTSAVLSSKKTTSVLGYQKGRILGPTLSIEKGTLLDVQFSNQLQENSNIHWHGLTPPAPMDGHPDDTLSTGQIFRYQFRVNNRAVTYWYHPHPINHTASQVYKGLEGTILIRDTTEQKLH
jgi:FtsP/CotA-like multicopper oxidase with cupredoxin domain